MNPSSPHYAIYSEALMMTQACIVAGQVANGFACRTERESVFRVGLLTNRFLLIGQAVAIAIICVISYVPFAQNIFKTGPLTVTDWVYLVISAVVLFFAEEARKWLLRRKDAKKAAATATATANGGESA
jgi:magnesium-transporting ATPase (P-type)